MKIRMIVGVTAVLTLAACSGQAKPSEETPAASASSASSSAVATSTVATSAAASPGVGDKPTREFIVGKWGTDGDCTLAIDFRADGTSDGPFGNWSYSDGVIRFDEEPTVMANVTVIDDNTMESSNDGQTSMMTRCP